MTFFSAAAFSVPIAGYRTAMKEAGRNCPAPSTFRHSLVAIETALLIRGWRVILNICLEFRAEEKRNPVFFPVADLKLDAHIQSVCGWP